ncbi:MAG: hypothetical protein M0042_07090 [Nitrospiraceae bacterium]|nr:hypothetical protein [Nitrospiraceae bacterium]
MKRFLRLVNRSSAAPPFSLRFVRGENEKSRDRDRAQRSWIPALLSLGEKTYSPFAPLGGLIFINKKRTAIRAFRLNTVLVYEQRFGFEYGVLITDMLDVLLADRTISFRRERMENVIDGSHIHLTGSLDSMANKMFWASPGNSPSDEV